MKDTNTNTICFIFKMAPLGRGQRCSSTTADIYHFILYASFLLNHNPLLLVGLCFQSLCAGIQYLFLCTAQTGSLLWKNLGAENPENRCSYSSEVHDDDNGKPYVLSTGKGDLKSSKRLIEISDRDFAFESKSVMKTVECCAHADVPHVKNRFDLQDKFSLLGIQDIVSQLASYESKNLNIAVKKEDISFFPGFELPSFWSAGEPGISLRKGTDFGAEDMNLHVPLTGKTMKVPEEHIDWLCFQQETCKLKTTSSNQDSMHTPTKEPSDAGATQDKTSDSSQKGGQTLPEGGKAVAQASKSLQGSSNYSRSSSGSGGDDGGDDRKQNVPAGGCQGDGQCSVDDNEDPKQQPEDQSHKDGDYSYNQDSMSTPAKVPSDTGTTQGNNASNPKECQTPSDGGKTPAQVSKKESTNYSRSSSGSGGDDGDDDRKKNVPTGGCQGDSHCDVEDKEEREQQPEESSKKDDDDGDNDDDVNDEKHSLPQMSDDISVGRQSHDSTKKSTGQGLRIDVSGARTIAQASFDLPELSIESTEAACGSFLSDQFNYRHLVAGEIEHSEAEQSLQQAFKCHRNLNSEREWKKCEKASCREVQGFLDHSQNCHMRVLGGCDKCIHYKNILLYHASRCRLPLGQCVVPKCDYIRQYAKKSSIPENRKWKYEHDQLFFRRTPPTTPTAQESQPSFAEATPDYHELMAQLAQAEFHSLNTDYLISDESLTSFSGESLHDLSGAWNQYHVDRPPDLQVARGPTATEHVKLEQEQLEDDVQAESVAPLSATCMPVRDTSQTVKSTTQEERGEVIWPLNKEKLSVGEDGAYLEDTHWMSTRSIGGGSCGRCFLCTDLCTGCLFAIKKIPVKKFEINEIEIWGSLSGQHPNILELYGAVKYRQTVIIFMEYMSGGSVEEYAGRMSEFLAVHILGKVISAVEFMHSQRILHRDIKGGNVLLDDTGHQVKLADYGMSVRCENVLQDNNPRGTEPFMAPEVCRSEYHSFSADIWSLMCLLHQMLAGKPPWMEFYHGSLLFKIGTATHPPRSPPCSPEVEDLFSQGFNLVPAERATAAELLRHQVFVSAPPVPYITLPSREKPEPEPDLDEDSSFSSNTSGSETGSLVSDPSSDPFTTGCAVGNCDDDEEDDNDGDSDVSDDNDDSSNGFQELDVHEDEAGIFMEGPWQDLDMSAEQQLQSLQSELFLSLEGNELERLMNEIAESCDVNDNDVNLLNTEDFNVDQFIGRILSDADMASMQPMSAASVTPEWSYSITDLTKLHIKDSNGKLVFTIRERPITTYGSLGEEHHGNIASVLKLDAFSLTRDDGTLLNVRAEIGSEEQAVRVVRAHDTDNWQSYRWRVDVYGRVEEFFTI